MTSTPTIDTEAPAADVVVGASISQPESPLGDPANGAAVEKVDGELPLDLRSVGELLTVQIQAATALLKGLPKQLVKASSHELAAIAAAAAGMVAAANAAQAAVVLEADSRGVIAESDNPRVAAWVAQSCREADVPVARAQARRMADIVTACSGYDLLPLRDTVVAGGIPVDIAASTAKLFKRVKPKIDYPDFEDLVGIVVEAVVDEEHANLSLGQLEDWLVARYAREGLLDDHHEYLRTQRDLTGFRRDRHGMLTATLKLDPASEAVFSAAITSLAAPHLDEKKEPDPRSPGQRRADALITLAGQATTPTKDIRGSGANARVIVTIGLQELLSGLDKTEIPAPRRQRPELGDWATRIAQTQTAYSRDDDTHDPGRIFSLTSPALNAPAFDGARARTRCAENTGLGTSAGRSIENPQPPTPNTATPERSTPTLLGAGGSLDACTGHDIDNPTSATPHRGAPTRLITGESVRDSTGIAVGLDYNTSLGHENNTGLIIGAGRNTTGLSAGDGLDSTGLSVGPGLYTNAGFSAGTGGQNDDPAEEQGEYGCGTTAYRQVLSPTEVRILSCDAHIVPAVLGTSGELLDIGRAKRLITPGLSDALHLRDGGCTYPGCTAPPRFCDGHHIIYWARGGPTDMSNLALLCRHHHTVVHRHDHTATIDDTGGVHWTRHNGSPIGNTPRVAQSF